MTRPARRRPPAVARVLERVTSTARRHEMFASGDVVIVACSGGPDSTCLLQALHDLRRLLRIKLQVFHFDHGLHPTAGRHAAYVKRQTERLGLPFVLRRAEEAPPKGVSVESWARSARYAALSEEAVKAGADRLALGHTMNDQAETVLLGLIRGGGLDGVAGMDPVATVPPLGLVAVRPLLETGRDEVEGFCRARGLRPREDPTNRDLRFLRNRIRHRLLPLLEKEAGRGLAATLARTAAHVRSDAGFLESLASRAARDVVEVGEREIRVRANRLRELPEPVASRVAKHALRLAAAMRGALTDDVESAHVRTLLDLASGRPRRRADLPGALLAVRDREYVRLSVGEGE